MPQVEEHAESDVQAPTQLTGHGESVHKRDSVDLSAKPQGMPPLLAGVEILKVRDSLPFPHVTEHELHEVQEPTQLTGQGCVLQGCD